MSNSLNDRSVDASSTTIQHYDDLPANEQGRNDEGEPGPE